MPLIFKTSYADFLLDPGLHHVRHTALPMKTIVNLKKFELPPLQILDPTRQKRVEATGPPSSFG